MKVERIVMTGAILLGMGGMGAEAIAIRNLQRQIAKQQELLCADLSFTGEAIGIGPLPKGKCDEVQDVLVERYRNNQKPKTTPRPKGSTDG